MAVSPPNPGPALWLRFLSAGRWRIPVHVQLAILSAMLPIGLCGCIAGLAPLAVEAVGSAVSTVTGAAEGAVIEAHQGSVNDEDHPNEDQMAREDRCSELQMNAPWVIEVRKGPSGAPQYRQLQLGGALDRPQWNVMTDQGTDAGGWRPAAKLLAANFNPPLGPLPDAKSDYVAYKAVEQDSVSVVDPAATLSVNFVSATGTFTWNGQVYEYALGHKLPCFPPPAQ
jgi:hypothetical protein